MLAGYTAAELGALMAQFFLGLGGLIGAIFAGMALKEARRATEASKANGITIDEVKVQTTAIDNAVNGKPAGQPTISETVDEIAENVNPVGVAERAAKAADG